MRSKTQAILRQEAIIRMLDDGGSVSVQVFSETLHCSYATIRNDLALLEEKGLVLRTHGGAVRTEASPVIGLRKRENAFLADKRMIARRAFDDCVREGMTLILDSGTTNLELSKVIMASGMTLTVLTHSAPVIQTLIKAPNVSLFAFGGFYNGNSDAFYDGNLRTYAQTMHADIYFMGFNGILPQLGFAHAVHFEQETKRIYLAMSSRTVAIGDASKLTQSGLWITGTFKEIRTLVTNERIDPGLLKQLTDQGLEVLIAQEGEGR